MFGDHRHWAAAVLLALSLQACVLAPRETEDEQQRMTEAGRAFEAPIEARELPALPEQPDWPQLLAYAFHANGELEAAHAEWRAAMERVTIAAGYPNTNTQLNFQYLFSGGQMKSWDRTTLTAGFDPMVNLSFPLKTIAAGKVALADARVAGERFRAAKFGLQQRVLNAFYDYALVAERVRLARQMLQWSELLEQTAAARVQVGASQQDVVAAQIAARLAHNELQVMESELPQQRAMLNGLIGRAADATLDPPERLPGPRTLPTDDARLLAVVSQSNPDLSALAQAAQSREHALEAARLRFIPDVNPFVGLTGSISQVAGAALILPTTFPQIRASIRESQAMLDASNAMLRQGQRERAAQVVATLTALRDTERQVQFFDGQILPALELNNDATRTAYSAGSAELMPFVESERMRLDTRRQLAELRMAREQRLAELEALAGVDIETFDQQPSAQLAVGEEGGDEQ